MQHKHTAQGLASLGRGPDTELVHMTKGEVHGLQKLAMAHGGTLTINPETGLAEAGFLSSLLPMMIGAGLSVASGGALTPMMAAMMTAGGYGVATGSLKKGLMAGMGAYGGAGLGAGLAEAGMSTAANTQLASDAAYKTAQETMQTQATALGQNALPYTPEGFAAQAKDIVAPVTNMQNAAMAGQREAFANAGVLDQLKTAGSGISSLGSEAGRAAFMQGAGGKTGLMQAGLAAAGPLFGQTPATPPAAPGDASMGQRYSYSPGVPRPQPAPDVPGYGNQGQNFGKEQRYYNPAYTPISPDAAKTMYGYAGGGPIEAMSNANAIGANTGYPMADIHTGAYATPFQQPMSENVVQGSQDSAVDPYTGQAQFADGGDVGGYSYDPATQRYAQNSQMVAPSPTMSGMGLGTALSTGEILPAYSYNPATKSFTQTRAGQAAPIDVGSDSGGDGGGGGDSGGGDSGGGGGDGGGDGGDGGGEKNGGLMAAMAAGGATNLGGYSDGGRLLRGPGDGVSDSIPAVIGKKQPARLADGEFVIPARIVSELGNGSTEAGARQLYSMMERIQSGRQRSIGRNKVATNTRAARHLPA